MRNGRITLPPGEKIIRIECLPGSTLPGDLAASGYTVTPCDQATVCVSANVELEPITECSTTVVAWKVTHAGIVTVERYSFTL